LIQSIEVLTGLRTRFLI